MTVYNIHNLTRTYPGQTKPANKNITLQIAEGEISGLLEDNSAGKSTLVKQMVNPLPRLPAPLPTCLLPRPSAVTRN